MVWIFDEVSFEENDVALILSYGYMKKMMCASYYVVLVKGSTQEHPSSPISIESGTHTKQATFLGSTHVCFLCATFCDIINGA